MNQMRALIAYAAFVAIFGTLYALGLVSSAEGGAKATAAISGYLFVALIMGGVFFNGLIRSLKIATKMKAILAIAVAILAGLIAFGFFGYVGGVATSNLRAGWGDDVSQYTEYPIKGHVLIGLAITFIYLVISASGWFFALSDRAIAEKKRLEAERANS